MNRFMAIFFAVCAGIFTTFEDAINSKLSSEVTPKIATLHNLMTGVLVILLANILNGTLNEYTKVLQVNPQLLIGGVFGTFIVYLGIRSIPQLGVATTLAVIVVAQLLSALFVDVFLYGHRILQNGKLLGIILLTIGTYFILKE